MPYLKAWDGASVLIYNTTRLRRPLDRRLSSIGRFVQTHFDDPIIRHTLIEAFSVFGAVSRSGFTAQVDTDTHSHELYPMLHQLKN